MTDHEAMSRGMTAAADATEAMATHDHDTALRALNSLGSQAEATWAAAALLSALSEAVDLLAQGDTARYQSAMRAGAEGMRGEDEILTRVALIVAEAERGQS